MPDPMKKPDPEIYVRRLLQGRDSFVQGGELLHRDVFIFWRGHAHRGHVPLEPSVGGGHRFGDELCVVCLVNHSAHLDPSLLQAMRCSGSRGWGRSACIVLLDARILV